MARTARSPSSSFSAASSAAVISASMALRFSGRSSVTTATCSWRSTLTGTAHLRALPEVPADDLVDVDGDPGVPPVVGQRLPPLVLRGEGALHQFELGDGELSGPRDLADDARTPGDLHAAELLVAVPVVDHDRDPRVLLE